ncbi:transmembrane amino acid transporter protein-domain-containing protein [Kockovaella imperatae]|uniref:Transmembrane amino acid transporter protein-domain-containing protein n=1 Tax=Kockovaella imperatae TaxID=4999 RepID=A0A1Y1U7U3_9TREE|nr:transmembrane amino acid transporter protein-domain-containing protein [Kockovaella imperatae]ORX33577.1 transmembrane amino acid transporter protein-domain-containing protein [Kockovaella imperatae]
MSYGSVDRGGASSRDARRNRIISTRSVRSTRTVRDVHAMGHASILSSVTNLANTVIGAGALAFPSAFAAMGLIPGILSCIYSGCVTSFGLYLLTRCATMVARKPGDEGRKPSFTEVARIAFGKGWATRLFDFAIAIKCFGVSISYLIICKTLLPQVTYTFAKAIHHPLPEDSILHSQDFWLVAMMIVIVPLSFLKTLDSLRFTSQIALSTVVYLIIVVVGSYALKGPSANRGEVVLARFGRTTLSSLPVQVFAFTDNSHLFQIFPIYCELKDKTQKRLNTVIAVSIGSSALCYEVIGYLTFGDRVGSNIIAMYPATSIFIAIGRFGIVLLVGFSYPLQLLPCRQCVHGLTSGLLKSASPDIATASSSTTNQPEADEDEEELDEDDSLLRKDDDEEEEEERGPGDMSRTKFITITVLIVIVSFLIAAEVDELEVVLGFVGSTGSTILSFILPGFFHFALFRQEKGRVKWFALALGIYGIAVMCFSLTYNIVNLQTRHTGKP